MGLFLMSGEDVVASTKAFWEIMRLVYEELCNTYPAFQKGNVCRMPPDGNICKDTPGIFGYLSHYLVAIEPQMRKALHGHGLLGVVGFTSPEEFFAQPGLADRVKRMWHYTASICFRSVEGYAAHMFEPERVKATLATAPLMPVTAKQSEALGPRRAATVYDAQLAARGMTEKCPPEALLKRTFTPWTPSDLRAADLSSGAWASLIVADVNAGNRACGNHVCRPEVCNKTTRGRDGYCRMNMWHYARILCNGKDKVVKAHGRELQRRWSVEATTENPFPAAGIPGEFPPFHTMPPQAGMPSLETAHAFHVKTSPVVLTTARCNNDVTPLIRISNNLRKLLELEVSSGKTDTTGVDEAVYGKCVDDMLADLADMEFYCAEYASKEQPHIEGLLQVLHNGVGHIELDMAKLRASGQDVSVHEHGRRVLHRLVSCTNRRMHKGFPEMVSYILGKPHFIASHEFVGANFDPPFRALRGALYHAMGFSSNEDDGVQATNATIVVPGTSEKTTLTNTQFLDYNWRHSTMDAWPWYLSNTTTIYKYRNL